jgi:hypothetical protein
VALRRCDRQLASEALMTKNSVLNNWMSVHNAVIMTVFCLVIAAKLLADGVWSDSGEWIAKQFSHLPAAEIRNITCDNTVAVSKILSPARQS